MSAGPSTSSGAGRRLDQVLAEAALEVLAITLGAEVLVAVPGQSSQYFDVLFAEGGAAGGDRGALAGQVAGKLGSLFHKKKTDSQNTAAEHPGQPTSALPDGLVPIVTMTSELVSVSSDTVSPSVFDIPPDFKKIERRND